MLILSGFSALDIEQPTKEDLEDGLPTELITEIVSALSTAYDDECTDKSSYLYEDGVTADSFLIGAYDPAKLLEKVAQWIPDIQKAFVIALNAVYTPGMAPTDIKVDTTATYDLQKAAQQLDNNWYSYSDYGVYLENNQGFPFFRVFPDEDQMARVKEHPEEFFLVDITVKS